MDSSKRIFLVSDDGKKHISITKDKLQSHIDLGKYGEKTIAWTKGMGLAWLPLSDPHWEKYEIKIPIAKSNKEDGLFEKQNPKPNYILTEFFTVLFGFLVVGLVVAMAMFPEVLLITAAIGHVGLFFLFSSGYHDDSNISFFMQMLWFLFWCLMSLFHI